MRGIIRVKQISLVALNALRKLGFLVVIVSPQPSAQPTKGK